uniref:EB domain-containing protein n=1 Tax=Trichuris muris TaxID=70415 RepID=A0A5S6QS78_TRIMR
MLIPLFFVSHLLTVEMTLHGRIGYECDDDHSCHDAHSECRFDRCHCQSGYGHSYEGSHVECIKLPMLGEPCVAQDDKRHSSCSDPHGNCVNGICVCGDMYENRSGKCVFVERTIGQSCKADRQCITPFTYCSEAKTCACRPGFKDISTSCVPVTLRCLEGAPLNISGEIITCTASGSKKSTCPRNSYCVSYIEHEGHWSCLQLPVHRGFCCPQPNSTNSLKSTCPAGEALSPYQPCPLETHFVHMDYNIPRKGSPCCPRPCPIHYSYINGRCYSSGLQPGDFCQLDDQCSCGTCNVDQDNQKRCQCKPGFIELYGKCHDERCFHGEPATDMATGDLITCNATAKSCPGDYLCVLEFGLCCPRMPIYS